MEQLQRAALHDVAIGLPQKCRTIGWLRRCHAALPRSGFVQLLFSEVTYNYTPIGIGYVMKTNVMLSDVAYTRPRQVVCLVYNSLPAPDPNTGVQCPTPP